MALWVYGETGSFATASRESGIPSNTIKAWVDGDEDGSIAAETESLQLAVRSQIAHKAARYANQAIDQLGKALNLGDEHWDAKRGCIVHIKPKAKDLAWIVSILVDKHALLTGLTAGRQVDDALRSVADRLVSLVTAGVAAQQQADPDLGLAPSDLG